MASRAYENFLQAMRVPMVSPQDSLEVAQAKLTRMHHHPIAEETRVRWHELGGVSCASISTPGITEHDRMLFLCHGGAYIAAGGDGYLFYAEMLSAACRSQILLVDYRLAPEHRHPAALDDLCNAYRALLDSGTSPQRVHFIGDSCGGGLMIAALLRLRDADVALPRSAVALGGWFDLESGDRGGAEWENREPFAHPAFTRARGRDYVGPEGDLRDPFVSTLHADLRGLPPLLLQVGSVDLTRDEAEHLARNAKRDGVSATLSVHPEMIHGFQGLARAGIPEAQAALAEVTDFLDDREKS